LGRSPKTLKTMKNILILGGTGFVGRHLCEKLAELPAKVTVLTRKRASARHLQMLPMLDIVELPALSAEALAPLLVGMDAVVNLIAILHGDEAAFDRAHVQIPTALAAACQTAGVRRLVHVSSLGADANAPSMYQRSKARGEAVLAASKLDVSVLRPSVIFGDGDKFLNTFAALQKMLPVVPLAGSTARFQPVWVQDVADALVACLQSRDTIGQTFEACGPDVFTLKELVQLAGRYSGNERPVVGLPNALARIQAGVMELAPGEPIMSRDNLDAMKVDNVASGKLPGLSALGITPSALAAIAPSYLGGAGLRSGLMGKRKTAGRF
jgi:uncharacterized protein YbjT (DUF2867 family)